MASMIFGCGCAALSSARTSLRLKPSRLGHLVHEGDDLRALQIEGGGGDRLRERRSAGECRKRARGGMLFNYDPTSLRREYSAMRIPKPARSVTTELPP